MGLSSNQARFLSLTARQVDLEHRIQQICQRRLRLTSELENIATSYNNNISNRKMFTPSNAGIQKLTLQGLNKLGYKVISATSKDLVQNIGLINKPTAPSATATSINTQEDFMNLITIMNGGDAAATAALAGNYVLNCDIDLSGNGTFDKNVISGDFTGIFDGQGHTISGVNINSTNGNDQRIGFFSGASSAATIKNLQLDDVNITAGDSTLVGINYTMMGALVGYNRGTIDNVAVTDSNITVGNNHTVVGGLVGLQIGQVSNSYANTDIITGDSSRYVGGFVGDTAAGSEKSSYSTGDVTVGNNCQYIAGFKAGVDNDIHLTQDCYSTGNVTAGTGSYSVGGFASEVTNQAGVSSVLSSYTTGNVIASGTYIGGFVGYVLGGIVGSDNFYKNNMPNTAGSAVNENSSAARPQDSWSTSIWDLSEDFPTLKGTNDGSEELEEGLRNGTYSLAREADEFSQNPFDIQGEEYQEIDWRSTPEIFDELYKGDDVAAENKYDKTVDEINSQDKKLQLEQTTIEVEYKAISSEKEAVKKILDTNAQSSFKYFS